MIDYLRDVKPLEDQGISDEVIAQHLRSAIAIPCSSAKEILQENGAVIIDPVTGDKSGLLISYYQTLDVGSESQVLIAYFIEHVFEGGIEVDTNVYPRSIQWESVTSAMPESLQGVVTAILEAAGGQPNPGLVAADIQLLRDEETARVAEEAANAIVVQALMDTTANYDALYNQHIAPLYNAADFSDASWIAALNAMASDWSN